MNKNLKKLLSGILVLALILQFAVMVVIAQPNTNELFNVTENFDGLANDTSAESVATEDSGWVYMHEKGRTATVQNEALYMTGYPVNDNQSGRVSLLTTEQFTDGYIQADVKIDAPTDSARTYYSGNMVARCLNHEANEIGIRFALKLNSQGKVTATLELLVRDPNMSNGSYYGTVTGVSANNYAIPEFDSNKFYNVKLQTIGNCVTVFLDSVPVISCTLDDTYAIASRTGSFGVANLSRNSLGVTYDNICAAALNSYTVNSDDGIAIQPVRDLKTITEMHDRTAFLPGETVTVEIRNTGLELSTLRAFTTENDVIELTEVVAGQTYSFVMPADNVTVSCENGENSDLNETEDLLKVTADFNGQENGTSAENIATADSGWSYASEKDRTAVVQNGALYMAGYPANDNLSGRVSLTTTDKFANGYIQADVKVDAPADSARTYYSGNMVARCVDHHFNEIGTRFALKLNANGTVKAVLELLVRDPNTNSGSYYGTVTGVAANSYTIPEFDVNKFYNVKIQTIGNCITVFLDHVPVITCALDSTYEVASRVGSFGIGNLNRNSTGVTYDNVVAISLKTHTVTTVSGIETLGIRDLKTVTTVHCRDEYAAGESVTLNVADASLNIDSLTVQTETGEPVALTEVLAQRQYTFIMPKESVTVSCEKLDDVPELDAGETLESLNFDGVANSTALSSLLDNTWVTSPTPLNANNFTVVNEAVATQYAFTATKNQAFNSGYIQADICIVEPTSALSGATGSKTVYGGNLSLRYSKDTNNTEELRARFKVTKNASGAYNADLELVVYNKNDSTYGTIPSVKPYTLTNFAFGKTYNVKLAAIGNYLEVSLDGTVVMQYCLDPDGLLTSFEGYAAFGHTSNSFAVTFDNIEIVKYDTYTVQKDRELADLLKLSQYAEPRTGKVYERNAFVAGERVTVDVLDASTLMVETLRYQTADGGETALKVNNSNKCSFYMPEEDVTILCSSLSNTADLPYFADFTGYPAGTTADTLFTAADGWSTVNSTKAFINEDGKLEVPATVDILTSQTFHNGYIQADIQIEEPDADGTYYAGNMYANYIVVGRQEIRTRFAITKKGDSSTLVLQLVAYDVDLSNGTDGNHYPQSPIVISHNVGVLDPDAVYTVKLEVIGNYIQVSLNGGVVISRTVNADWQISERVGSFGFGGHASANNAVSASYDNVHIGIYDIYSLTINDNMQNMIKMDVYPDLYNSAASSNRISFLAGEFVILYLEVVDGKTADTEKLQYISSSGSTPITAHNSETMYGFTMPAERIVVTSVAVDAYSGSEDGILFCDTFDEEKLMIDNGWERDAIIKNGALQLGTDKPLLTLNLTQKRGATDWTDYSAEATVMVTGAAYSDQDMVAAFCVRGGYEFGIYFPAGSQKGYFRLYDRTDGELLVSSVGQAVLGENYTLRIELRGSTLTGYVNGEKVFSVNDSTCASGTIGWRLSRAYIECDDIIVKEIS